MGMLKTCAYTCPNMGMFKICAYKYMPTNGYVQNLCIFRPEFTAKWQDCIFDLLLRVESQYLIFKDYHSFCNQITEALFVYI